VRAHHAREELRRRNARRVRRRRIAQIIGVVEMDGARKMPGLILLAAGRHRDGPTVRDAARVHDAHARIVAVRDEPSDVFEIGAGARARHRRQV
jgi:hypothetical protein